MKIWFNKIRNYSGQDKNDREFTVYFLSIQIFENVEKSRLWSK